MWRSAERPIIQSRWAYNRQRRPGPISAPVARPPWTSFHVQVDDLDIVIRAKRHVDSESGDEAPSRHKHPYAWNLLDLQRLPLVVSGEKIDDRRELVEEEVGCRLPSRVRSSGSSSSSRSKKDGLTRTSRRPVTRQRRPSRSTGAWRC